MVVAGEVKKPVHYKVRDMIAKGDALIAAFALAGLKSDRNVAEKAAFFPVRSKRKDVGRRVSPAKAQIERP